MMRGYLIILVLVTALLTSCAPTVPPATPTPSPPTHHFGIVDIRQDIDGITSLGIRWDRPHPGPFIWGQIEPEKGEYRWRGVDKYVQKVQSHDMATLATIWPFADWDQANWGPAGSTPLVFENKGLCRSRRKPYDMQAYQRFVSALVERYDGDGIDDMPGLKYPIKYWEAGNEPSIQSGQCPLAAPFYFFEGSPEDYLEILKTTYQAVKQADPEARVLHAGIAGMEPSVDSFWESIFNKGSRYFDIANIHCFSHVDVAMAAEITVPIFKEWLSMYGIDKPIWVTEAHYIVGKVSEGEIISPEEHAQIFTKSYVTAFACGADNVFYTSFKPHAPFEQAALIDENGEKKPAYYALKALISKLDEFTSAEKLAYGQYRFTAGGKAIYVLWGQAGIPEEIAGEVLVTDIYGGETKMPASALKVSDSPIFVEAAD